MDRTASSLELQLVDAAEIRRTPGLLLPPGQVTELRVLDAVTAADRWPHTASGYFDDGEKLLEALGTVKSARGVYLIPNPVQNALLARAANRLRKAGKGESTSDHDIAARRHFSCLFVLLCGSFRVE